MFGCRVCGAGGLRVEIWGVGMDLGVVGARVEALLGAVCAGRATT